jgi:hypothetical protein
MYGRKETNVTKKRNEDGRKLIRPQAAFDEFSLHRIFTYNYRKTDVFLFQMN